MDINTLFEQAVLNWRDNKGIGTAFIPSNLNSKVLVYQILARVYARSPTTTSIVAVNNFQERSNLIEFLTHSGNEENDEEFKKLINDKFIRIFTSNFIIGGGWNTAVNLFIWNNPIEYVPAVAFLPRK